MRPIKQILQGVLSMIIGIPSLIVGLYFWVPQVLNSISSGFQEALDFHLYDLWLLVIGLGIFSIIGSISLLRKKE